ncbi:cytochrome c551 [Peribacillus psychrosaccharolyticus]|uniref:cytochrome c551 n=1 Tax=Peribacillus psychrosaccharolyticus TaxID=1407 RepID=UPI003D2A26C5
MNKKMLGILLGTTLMLTACGGGDESKEPEGDSTQTASAEEKLYERSCAGCHGNNLEGAAGPKLSNVGSKLSKEDIETIIAEGKGIMPSEVLKGEDAANVAAWLADKK